MILFSILVLMTLFLIAFTIIVISISGGLFVILFGDVIVCIILLILLIKFILKK